MSPARGNPRPRSGVAGAAASVIVVLGLLVGCSGSYEAENEAIVADLPVFEGVSIIETVQSESCSNDSCLFGNDGRLTRQLYEVDTDRYTQQELLDAYEEALDGWAADTRIECRNADEGFCDAGGYGTFTQDSKVINLNLDNWPIGRFEIAVNARSGN